MRVENPKASLEAISSDTALINNETIATPNRLEDMRDIGKPSLVPGGLQRPLGRNVDRVEGFQTSTPKPRTCKNNSGNRVWGGTNQQQPT